MERNKYNFQFTTGSEESVIGNAIQGDSDAFSFLYAAYVNRIYSYIFYRTGNVAEAEDLTSRVFFRAFGHITNYKNMGLPFSAWLYRIAHNLIANWHRDNTRKKEVPLENVTLVIPKEDLPEVSLEKNQEIEVLLNVIRKMTPERQHLILLKYLEDLSNAEIAVIMDRSEGAIKSLYHRTLQELRDYYSESN